MFRLSPFDSTRIIEEERDATGVEMTPMLFHGGSNTVSRPESRKQSTTVDMDVDSDSKSSSNMEHFSFFFSFVIWKIF